MKLLLDQNLSYRLVRSIQTLFPGSEHVSKLGLTNALDLDIWLYAQINHFSIVTFDGDFRDLSVLRGHPPKVILLQTNNQTSKNVEFLITKHQHPISDFLKASEQSEVGCLLVSDQK